MWFARSDDDGATFAPEEPALAATTGACACCGTRALADSAASSTSSTGRPPAGVDRDMILLTSRDRGEHFEGRPLQPWKVTICPMSSESLVEAGTEVLAAWETQGQVYFAGSTRRPGAVRSPSARPGGGNRKHPAVADERAGRDDPGLGRGHGLAVAAGHSPGASSTDGPSTAARPAGSRGASPSGASRPSSPVPTAGSRSSTDNEADD